MTWYREGDFFQPDLNNSNFIHSVYYYHVKSIPVNIRSLRIHQYKTGEVILFIGFSSLFCDVQSDFYHHFKLTPILGNQVRINLNNSSITSINNWLGKLDEGREVSLDVLNDLQAIVSMKNANRYHRVPMLKMEQSHINPQRKDDKALVKFIKSISIPSKPLSPEHESVIKKHLVQGDDPNQEDGFFDTPLRLAIYFDDLNFIFLLMVYGALPFKPTGGGRSNSAIESAKSCYKAHEFDELMKVILEVKERQESQKNPVLVKDISFHRHLTYVKLTNGKKYMSVLRPSSVISKDECGQMIKVIIQSGFSNNETTLMNSLSPTRNRWVDTIYNENKEIIALVVFNTGDYKKGQAVMIDISCNIDPSFCAMIFFDYRFALAYQAVTKQMTYVCFLGASFESLRRLLGADDLAVFPVYQPESMIKTFDELFKKVFKNPLSWFYGKDGVYPTVKEGQDHVTVKPSKNKSISRWSMFYHTQLTHPNGGHVPVMTIVGIELLQQLKKISSRLDFEIAMNGFVPQLAKLLGYNAPNKIPSYPLTSDLFWNNAIEDGASLPVKSCL